MSVETTAVGICDRCGKRGEAVATTGGWGAAFGPRIDGWFNLTVFAWGKGTNGCDGVFCSSECLHEFVADYDPTPAPR